MLKVTITEGLAEIKTIDKRVEKKNEFIQTHLTREADRRDPLEKDGGQTASIAREKQAINDLLERKVAIRMAISRVNEANILTVSGVSRSIAEWLVWRRDVAPPLQAALNDQARRIRASRERSLQTGLYTSRNTSLTTKIETPREVDIVVNLNESDLQKEIETLEEILGTLDGLLSLKNATIIIDIP